MYSNNIHIRDTTNNKEANIQIYDLDTVETIRKRIAIYFNTLQKYIKYQDFTLQDLQSPDFFLDIVDYMTLIKSSKDFTLLMNKLQTSELKSLTLERDDILYPFIQFSIKGDPSQIQVLQFIIQDLPSDILRKSKEWFNSYTTDISKLKSVVDEETRLFSSFENIPSNLTITPFELDKIKFQFTIDTPNISTMELFNKIKLNEFIPYAFIDKFYKVLKDFIPPISWAIEDRENKEAIFLKVSQKSAQKRYDKTSTKHISEDYANVAIIINSGQEQGKETALIYCNLEISQKNVSTEIFKQRILDIFVNKFTSSKIQETEVNGTFLIAKQSLNRDIFADLLMTNILFSQTMYSDEFAKATKKEDSIWIHFNHPKTGEISANISEKVSDKGDLILKGKDIKNTFKYGSKYIRVKISKSLNTQTVQIFQALLSKYFNIYNQSYPRILEIYKKYIPSFGKEKLITVKDVYNPKLKEQAPEIFEAGYPTTCPHQPIIIDDNEIETYKKDKYEIMSYPAPNTLVDASGNYIPTRHYVCTHPKAKYPGLRDNPLANNDIIEFLPCCYETQQSSTTGSKYRQYFYDEEPKKQYTEQHEMIITNKFVEKDKYGTLPDDLLKLFRVYDSTENILYVRKGVLDTKNSFIECVIEGLGNAINNEADLQKIRDSIANNDMLIASARQEMYDYSVNDIKELLKDKNTYFDPRYFISLLETLYKCNIFIFKKNGNYGEMILPRFSQAYYKFKNNNKCIFILEHFGSISNHARNPRCELIVRWNKNLPENSENSVEYSFLGSSELSMGIKNIRNQMMRAYRLNTEILPIEFPLNLKSDKYKIQGQYIDSYGKVRCINFIYKENIPINLCTTPLQPFVLPELPIFKLTRVDIKIAIEFSVLIDMKILGHTQTDLIGKIGNTIVFIPIILGLTQIDDIPFYNNYPIIYPSKVSSTLLEYNHNKKLARYFTEYLLWIYSDYIYQLKGEKASEFIEDINIIGQFAKEKFVIKQNYVYGDIDKIFSMNSPFLSDDRKLIVLNTDMLKRVIYTLRLYIRRNKNKILNYRTKVNIENYYLDVSDFDIYHSQILLQNKDSILKLCTENTNKYVLYNSIQPDINEPYFFQNFLISNNIFLARNIPTLDYMEKIIETWKNEGYLLTNPEMENIGKYLDFSLFSYVSNMDITKYEVVGNTRNNYNINIIGYKINAIVGYTVLLTL